MTAGPVQVQHVEQAVQLGMDAAAAYMAAAALTPGCGTPVALPASGAATGLGFDLPPEVPALRPQAPRPEPIQTYGSPLLAGLDHGGAVGFQTALEGIQVPSPAYRYVPVSGPRTPLLGRIRTAFGVLLGRR